VTDKKKKQRKTPMENPFPFYLPKWYIAFSVGDTKVLVRHLCERVAAKHLLLAQPKLLLLSLQV